MFTWPSAVRSSPSGSSVGWWLPSWTGISPSTVQRAAWKSIIPIIDSRSEVCTHCPAPVRSRSCSATRMPTARYSPAARSETAMPARAGPVPGSPVTLISPPRPWAIWSTPPRSL